MCFIGRDEDSELHCRADVPDGCSSFPGDVITRIDGQDVEDRFEAFVHAPFKDHCAGGHNRTSLALQVQLRVGDGTAGRLVFLGGRACLVIEMIFENGGAAADSGRVERDVLLSPRSCSRKSVYAWGRRAGRSSSRMFSAWSRRMPVRASG
ncbi:hypothetical protein LUR56_39330 [Streptomyces sp. MT29]|nr:hypothetical protein [Streptomyces sp. MT29]